MYPPPWKGWEELLATPFSATWASCVSSCVDLKEATLSSSKPFTLVDTGTVNITHSDVKHTRFKNTRVATRFGSNQRCESNFSSLISTSNPTILKNFGSSYSPFFFASSPSLSLSSDEDEEEDDEDEEPDEQDDDEDEELDPECDDDEDDDEDEEERDEELDEEPSESDSEPRMASLRPLLLAFLGFLSVELGVSGLVRAATICLSLSLTMETGFSSRPVGVAGR